MIGDGNLNFVFDGLATMKITIDPVPSVIPSHICLETDFVHFRDGFFLSPFLIFLAA